MKKRVFSVLASCLMIATSGMTVCAKTPEPMTTRPLIFDVVSPMWTDTSYASPYLSANGTTLNAFVDIGASNSGTSCSGTLYIDRYQSGRWSVVASRSVSGTGTATASLSAVGVKGGSYRARIYVKVGRDTLTNTTGTVTIK